MSCPLSACKFEMLFDECGSCPGKIKKVDSVDDFQELAPRPFTAKYAGHCSGCGLPTYPGQQIIKDGERFNHVGC